MNLRHLRPALLIVLFALSISMVGCGPTAEEQAGADRMQKGMDASRNAMNAPQGGLRGGASTPATR